MNKLKLITSKGDLKPEDKKILTKGLLAHHARKGHPRKSQKLSIALKDKNNKLKGAIIVTFLWNGMEINSLWVDDSLRKQGWGKKLVQEAEKEAIKRSCTVAYTNTFTWQAPEFYKKLGYTLYGKLENFPKGKYLSYFKKELK